MFRVRLNRILKSCVRGIPIHGSVKALPFIPFFISSLHLHAHAFEITDYPLFPLRKDLGESLLPGEKEAVQAATQSVDEMIRNRFEENGFIGREKYGKSHNCYPAELTFHSNIPSEYAVGMAQNGHRYPSIVRFSNFSASGTPDRHAPSLGLALKVKMETNREVEFQDFLADSSKVFMYKDIISYADSFSRLSKGRLRDFFVTFLKYPKATIDHMIRPKFRREKNSLLILDQTFWSSSPYAWGNRAAKYRFTPCHQFDRGQMPEGYFLNPDYQKSSLESTLSKQAICYQLEVQLRPFGESWREEDLNGMFPIEDATFFWPIEKAPYTAIAQMTINQNTRPLSIETCEHMSFNPWQGLSDHQPLGSLNRSRLVVYRQGQATREELMRKHEHYGDRNTESLMSFFLDGLGLSKEGQLLFRISKKYNLMKEFFFNPEVDPDGDVNCAEVMPYPHRTASGTCYFHNIDDVDYDQEGFEHTVHAGAQSARFGRNAPSPNKDANLLSPNPREISLKLFTRKDGMMPASTVNLLAVAWIQAQLHDWFSHGKNVMQRPSHSEHLSEEDKKKFDPIFVPPLPRDEIFPHGMLIPRTRPDLSATSEGDSLVFRNTVTHWWDASQIYGSDKETILKVRTNPLTGKLYPHGKIAVDEVNRRLYYDERGYPITGFFNNWWVGLELFHSLFAMEHNFVVDMLKETYPNMTDQKLFDTARLITTALITKIHVIEWDPAVILDNPALHKLKEGCKKPFPVFLFQNCIKKNLINSFLPFIHRFFRNANPHPSLPYPITEEFVAFYRMHALIPDYFVLYTPQGELADEELDFNQVRDTGAMEMSYISPQATQALMYTLGFEHPGKLSLHNYPRFMQNIEARNNVEGMPTIRFDLGAVDILRDRERGIPRYNEVRRLLGLPPIESFSDLTSHLEDIALLEEIYGGDVEKLDLLVGALAEGDRYEEFLLGNTSLHFFLLMGSRLMVDPFYLEYFTPEIYTPEGHAWVIENTMADVILRHYPELTNAFIGVTNAFHPWNKDTL